MNNSQISLKKLEILFYLFWNSDAQSTWNLGTLPAVPIVCAVHYFDPIIFNTIFCDYLIGRFTSSITLKKPTAFPMPLIVIDEVLGFLFLTPFIMEITFGIFYSPLSCLEFLTQQKYFP